MLYIHQSNKLCITKNQQNLLRVPIAVIQQNLPFHERRVGEENATEAHTMHTKSKPWRLRIHGIPDSRYHNFEVLASEKSDVLVGTRV